MKKIKGKYLLIIICICFVHSIHGQSSHSIGVNTSYLSHFISYTKFHPPTLWKSSYETPQLGIVYNYFLNKQHGLVSELGVNRAVSRLRFPQPASEIVRKDYNFNYSLQYIFKYKAFFIKSGLNIQAERVIRTYRETYLSEVYSMYNSRDVIIDKEFIRFVPAYHLALGKDFNLGKVDLRVNGFVNKAFENDDYFELGLSVGVFYKIKNK